MKKSQLTPRAPDKCGALPALSSKRPQTADSASGGFVRQVPPLPVTPAVRRLIQNEGNHETIIFILPEYHPVDSWGIGSICRFHHGLGLYFGIDCRWIKLVWLDISEFGRFGNSKGKWDLGCYIVHWWNGFSHAFIKNR